MAKKSSTRPRNNYDPVMEARIRESNRKGSHSVMMRMVSIELNRLIDLYEKGFGTFEPDEESMDNIRDAAGELWDAFNNANLFKANAAAHYARRDTAFQRFLSKITDVKETD